MDDPTINVCPTCFETCEVSRNLCQKNLKNLMDLLNFLMGFEIKVCNNQFNICSKCGDTLEEILRYKQKFRESYDKFCESQEKKTVDLLSIEPHSTIKCHQNNSLENANNTNSHSDTDYTPPTQTTDTDSDDQLLIHLKTSSINKQQSDTNAQIFDIPRAKTKRKTKARIQQYPVKDVIDAIAEATSYMTNIKNRVCLHCDFTSNLVKGLYHHMRKHKYVVLLNRYSKLL